MPIGETAGDIELEDGRQKGLVNRNVGVGSSQGAV